MSAAPVHGLVLAGGRSRRLGRDKAALRLAGRSLLELAVDRLTGLVDTVCVSVACEPESGDPRAGHRWIVDREPGGGPMAGLLAARDADPTVAWLVLAVDMPAVRRETLAKLMTLRDPSRAATVLRTAQGPEPLTGIYEPDPAQALEAAYERGERSLRRWLATVSVRWLDRSAAETGSINTAEAWALLRNRMES